MEDPSNILFWEEDDVHHFLCGLGFKGYEAQIKEHQINGEILVQCDHEALKDVGIHSVGQRLAILKAVYQLKLQYDVPIEEGHWVPPSEFIDQVMVDSPAGVIPPDRMFELLRERDDRIQSLETSLMRLSDQLNGMRDEVYGINKALFTKEPPIPINKLRPNQASPTSSGFPRAHLRNGSAHLVSGSGNEGSPAASPLNSLVRTTHEALHSAASTSSTSQQQYHLTDTSATSGAGGLSHSSSVRRRVNNYFGASNAAHHNGLLSAENNNSTEQLPTSPNPGSSPLPISSSSSNNNNISASAGYTLHEPSTPTASTYLQSAHGTSAGPSISTSSNNTDHAQAIESLQSAAMTSSNRHGHTDGAIQIPPPSSSSSLLSHQRPATAQAMSTSPGGTSLVLPNRPSTSAETPSGMSSSTGLLTPASGGGGTGGNSEKKGSSSSSSDNPYKSFRVTLEDPCYKVLPAALKKYKINDDWRQYALFICYGNQERCLSYDEKPLSLFQKLKDSNQNPVFMLRHIKDIKSPIAVAHTKHAARREKRIKEGKHIIGEGREGSIREFTRATRLHHPTNLQPVKGSPNSPNPGASHLDDENKDSNKEGKDDDNGDKDGKDGSSSAHHHGLGYALAIYPYMADRDDEFDVNVGDTFVILNKTKGWWVVHRDTKATKESDIVRSGWVPQGCLLETSVPPSRVSSSTPLSASTPINPLSIVSVSTPGLALMDYTQKGSDEITMKKGDKLRVFKRYNYWSYVIKESTGERGWTPSWFVGKFSSSSSSSGGGGGGGTSATSTPTSALGTGLSNLSQSSLNTPNSTTPLSALPVSTTRKEASSSSAGSSNDLGGFSVSGLGAGAGDTTPTSATMITS